MKIVLTSLAQSGLIQWRLIVAALAAVAGTHKKNLCLGTITFIISNGGMNDNMKMVKLFEDSNFWWNMPRKQLKMKKKKKEANFSVCY